MVVFICSVCGQSLKKNQVDKHCTGSCRNCEMVSCVDCGKEFWGNDYSEHIKCISEEQKYSGKLYKGPVGASKGEMKQESWTQQVQRAIERVGSGDGAVKGLLQQIQQCVNIPRKQAKFINFLKNSMRIRNEKLIEKAWSAIQAEIQKDADIKKTENNENEKDKNDGEVNTKAGDLNNVKNCENDDKENEKKEKKEKKKKRRKEMEDEEPPKVSKLEETDDREVFSWSGCIYNILLNHQEISVKKLKKKFLKEFRVNCKKDYEEEKINEKFTKKLTSNSKWTVENDIVKLKN